jgi:hypothetical protein
MVSVPAGLVGEINRGNCVAFVGAGFSLAAGVPSWKDLLVRLAETEGVDATLRDHVRTLVERPAASAHDLDQAAQMLVDELTQARFVARLREIVQTDTLPAVMQERLRCLRGIPFKAILTTNFDGILRSREEPEERASGARARQLAAYRAILRKERSFWWQEKFWDQKLMGARILKLHGDLDAPSGEEGIVFTREDYRSRLYGDPAYVSFLRSVLSTSTVLYLGFSFTDAYLNELRSEVLALLGHGEGSLPVAYAVVADTAPASVRYLRRHEGIEVLRYDSSNPPGHAGFDAWLAAIHKETSPLRRLGEMLGGKRILWMDPWPENNTHVIDMLDKAARSSDRDLAPPAILRDPTAAIAALLAARDAGPPFDLVITYWGRPWNGRESPGAELLSAMRAADLRCPTLVFASMHDAERRKQAALSLGALGYCTRSGTLLRRIEEIFAPAAQTW